jgi:hypothetical protein
MSRGFRNRQETFPRVRLPLLTILPILAASRPFQGSRTRRAPRKLLGFRIFPDLLPRRQRLPPMSLREGLPALRQSPAGLELPERRERLARKERKERMERKGLRSRRRKRSGRRSRQSRLS